MGGPGAEQGVGEGGSHPGRIGVLDDREVGVRNPGFRGGPDDLAQQEQMPAELRSAQFGDGGRSGTAGAQRAESGVRQRVPGRGGAASGQVEAGQGAQRALLKPAMGSPGWARSSASRRRLWASAESSCSASRSDSGSPDTSIMSDRHSGRASSVGEPPFTDTYLPCRPATINTLPQG